MNLARTLAMLMAKGHIVSYSEHENGEVKYAFTHGLAVMAGYITADIEDGKVVTTEHVADTLTSITNQVKGIN